MTKITAALAFILAVSAYTPAQQAMFDTDAATACSDVAKLCTAVPSPATP